jgi:hypothetical protein
MGAPPRFADGFEDFPRSSSLKQIATGTRPQRLEKRVRVVIDRQHNDLELG